LPLLGLLVVVVVVVVVIAVVVVVVFVVVVDVGGAAVVVVLAPAPAVLAMLLPTAGHEYRGYGGISIMSEDGSCDTAVISAALVFG
jgi:hypothetical protein